jgi:hypothetical protein
MKTHLYKPTTVPSQDVYGKGWTLCTNYVYSSHITTTTRKVNCGHCLRILRSLKKKGSK